MNEHRAKLETEAREAATAFRLQHGLGTAPIADMIELAETALGADVIVADMPRLWDSLTLKSPQSSIVLIAVGTSANPERQRFSIAHEIAHLYYGEFSHGSEDDPIVESRAETFARHLLLPQEALNQTLQDNKRQRGSLTERDLSDIVSLYRISGHAAAIQMKETGWISEDTCEEWSQVEAAHLAPRYGWASERSARVNEAQTARPPKRILGNALDAYVDGVLGISSVAIVDVKRGVEQLEEELKLDGVVPNRVEPKRISIDALLGKPR